MRDAATWLNLNIIAQTQQDSLEVSTTMKLKRGTFAATFMLACLAALKLEGIGLNDI
jgi:hypothetical protein